MMERERERAGEEMGEQEQEQEPIVEVRLDGRAMVRPAQPSPSHPFFLSCLDLFWQDVHYNRRLIFYESTAGISGQALLQQVKSSLALCLVYYYPWCGRIAKGALPPHRLFIDCNDAGVEFVEASSDYSLSTLARDHFQMRPFFLHLSQFPDHKGDSLYSSPLLSIQATLFSDGGLALGIAQSHMVADGHSLWNFMVSWGECSRGVPLSLPPLHHRERLTVPDPSPEKANWTLSPQMDEEEEEMEPFVVQVQNGKDNGSPSMETPSTIPDKRGSNLSKGSTATGAEGEPASTGPIPHGHISSAYSGGNAHRKREDPVTQGSKKTEADRNGNVGTESSTAGEKGGLNSNGDKESAGETKASLDDDPLVQCIFELPSVAVKKLKGEAGGGLTSYEVLCAHFWQRMTIARQSPRGDPTSFAVLMNCRTWVTPPLSPAYFGNVIIFRVALSTVGKICSESLRATASRIHNVIALTQEAELVSFMHWLETHGNRFPGDGSPQRKGRRFNVASSPWFPAYQVDFGWGTPSAVRPVKAAKEGELILFGGRPGSVQGDVEVCASVPDSVLRRLLEDPVFLAKPLCSPYVRE